jgi:hypothetical protein
LRAGWERYLERWTSSGLIEAGAAGRIRQYEAERDQSRGLHWPVWLAVSFGALMVGAGVLLFVASHWDKLSPGGRFTLVLLMVGVFHAAGAFAAERFPALSSALHAVGTITLGAGIFLAMQIFNLEEHWPAGLLLWALGAWAAWLLRREWPQAVLAAVLTPVWLSGEWFKAAGGWAGSDSIAAGGFLLLAITYLTAVVPGHESLTRKALAWIGGLALIPCTLWVVFADERWFGTNASWLSPGVYVLGFLTALILPLALAWALRGKAAWMNLVAAAWVVALCAVTMRQVSRWSVWRHAAYSLGPYILCGLAAAGMIWWGLKESRKARINLGIAGFALTILFFYFSEVMDSMGRAVSLAGLGALFLLGGWFLERTRRQLVAKVKRGES